MSASAESEPQSGSPRAEGEPLPPQDGWFLSQRWEDLLFCSWPVQQELLRELVPRELEFDTAEGTAWISVVPMWMGDVGLRDHPADPRVSGFPEVNVRTYVRCGGHKGVWFFSLDTQHETTVSVGRAGFHLPYVHATVSMERGDAITFRSIRGRGAAELDVTYRPSGSQYAPAEGSLEDFLTERYSMFCRSEDGGLFRGDIWHEEWRLRPVEVEMRSAAIIPAGAVDPPGEPLSFYASSIDVMFWPLVEAGGSG